MGHNTSRSRDGLKVMLFIIIFLIIMSFINSGLESLFYVQEDSPGEGLCGTVSFFLTCYLLYKLDKLLTAKKRSGITSLKDYFFHKENIHEVNFKAQFANFRKRHLQEMDADHWLLQGIHFDEIVNPVEERILLIASNPKNIEDGIDYEESTIAEILDEVLNKIKHGGYIYRGMPSMKTSSFITFYRKILEVEYKYGHITKEQNDYLLENLEEIIENNG